MDTFTTLEAANEYHEKRANASWALATEAAREAALIRATDYVTLTYTPAEGWLDDQGVPHAAAARAVIELAVDALTGPLLAKQERGIKSLSESGDGIGSITTVYDDVKGPADPYPHVTSILTTVACRQSDQSAWGGRVRK